MLKPIFFILGLLVITFAAAQAGSLELKINTRMIFIQEKAEWELAKDLFGMPYIYFSPAANGQRSNISFTDTGAEVELDRKALGSAQSDYQKNKKSWASTTQTEILSFLPYEVKVNEHGHKVHKIGLNYRHENKSYQEKSYYIECRGKILFAKSLRLTINEKHDKDFNELIQGLDCGGI